MENRAENEVPASNTTMSAFATSAHLSSSSELLFQRNFGRAATSDQNRSNGHGIKEGPQHSILGETKHAASATHANVNAAQPFSTAAGDKPSHSNRTEQEENIKVLISPGISKRMELLEKRFMAPPEDGQAGGGGNVGSRKNSESFTGVGSMANVDGGGSNPSSSSPMKDLLVQHHNSGSHHSFGFDATDNNNEGSNHSSKKGSEAEPNLSQSQQHFQSQSVRKAHLAAEHHIRKVSQTLHRIPRNLPLPDVVSGGSENGNSGHRIGHFHTPVTIHTNFGSTHGGSINYHNTGGNSSGGGSNHHSSLNQNKLSSATVGNNGSRSSLGHHHHAYQSHAQTAAVGSINHNNNSSSAGALPLNFNQHSNNSPSSISATNMSASTNISMSSNQTLITAHVQPRNIHNATSSSSNPPLHHSRKLNTSDSNNNSGIVVAESPPILATSSSTLSGQAAPPPPPQSQSRLPQLSRSRPQAAAASSAAGAQQTPLVVRSILSSNKKNNGDNNAYTSSVNMTKQNNKRKASMPGKRSLPSITESCAPSSTTVGGGVHVPPTKKRGRLHFTSTVAMSSSGVNDNDGGSINTCNNLNSGEDCGFNGQHNRIANTTGMQTHHTQQIQHPSTPIKAPSPQDHGHHSRGSTSNPHVAAPSSALGLNPNQTTAAAQTQTTPRSNVKPVKPLRNNMRITSFFGSATSNNNSSSKKRHDPNQNSSATTNITPASLTFDSAIGPSQVSASTSAHTRSCNNNDNNLVTPPSSSAPSSVSMISNLQKEVSSLKSKITELESLLNDKNAQLKAVANNQTIVHATLKSALQNREKEMESMRDSHKLYVSKVTSIIEDLIRQDSARELSELRQKLASDGARLGRLVYNRVGMHTVESWEEGQASKCNRRKKGELRKKREALEKRRKEGLLDDNKKNGKIQRDEVEIEEFEEGLKVHLDELRAEEKELEKEEENLYLEKAAHIRALKRVSSEDGSRFKNRPKLHDRYVLLSQLGKGGFSEVWRAYDLVELKEVAVKIHQLDPRWSDAKIENYTKHVAREYEIHRDVRHPRIVSLYDVFEIDTNSFATVLECCKGTDLDTLLKERKTLPERHARAILLQILSGMKYLSTPSPDKTRQGIIHYDLKPGNILFDEFGDAKITDFGLSKIMDSPDPADSMELTSQGAGTYWYLPPECFVTHQSVKISNKVDVWSIGVIFYQMLFGKRPFGDGQSQDKVLSNNIMLNARDVRFPDKPTVSDGCKKFIRQCLTYDQPLRPNISDLCQSPYLKRRQT